jgi:hypothetical protein
MNAIHCCVCEPVIGTLSLSHRRRSSEALIFMSYVNVWILTQTAFIVSHKLQARCFNQREVSHMDMKNCGFFNERVTSEKLQAHLTRTVSSSAAVHHHGNEDDIISVSYSMTTSVATNVGRWLPR